MKPRIAVALLALAALVLGSSPAVRADGDPLSYDDPGMHFKPPDGWQRIPLQISTDQDGPKALWVLRPESHDARTITLTIKSIDGPLDNVERGHESDLRDNGDAVFIDKHELLQLSNGMPAYWIRSSSGSEMGKFLRRYEWIVYDGERSIDLVYIGRQGDFDEKEAKDALASLYVVAYPRHRE